jgi:anaphase-promoting complex subunit 10
MDGMSQEKVKEWTRESVWMVTSSRAGHDIGRILESSLESFWQSEGPLPHIVTIQLPRVVELTELRIYSDFKLDESYTPLEVMVRVGIHRNDLYDLHVLELDKPHGWIHLPLLDIDGKPLPCYIIQLLVLSNYQDGRDSRLRSIKIFGLE